MQTDPSGINWQALGVYFYIAQWLFNIALAVWVYFRNADSENTRSIKTVADDLAAFITASSHANGEINTRQEVLSNTVAHMPTDKEVALLHAEVAQTKARLDGMNELLKRVDHQTTLISQHLLNKRS